MDRLICGDVGYGKTEIAIRAAFKAVQEISRWSIWYRPLFGTATLQYILPENEGFPGPGRSDVPIQDSGSAKRYDSELETRAGGHCGWNPPCAQW